MTSPRDNHDMIELAPIAGGQEGIESARITRAQLVAVIRQRLEHLTAQIEGALKELGFAGPFGRQVVLTGGGAELKGIADYAQGVLGPRGPDRPAGHAGPARRRIAAPLSRPSPASLCSRRRTRATCAAASPAAPAATTRGSGGWLVAPDCGISDSVLTNIWGKHDVNVNFLLAPQNRFVQKDLVQARRMARSHMGRQRMSIDFIRPEVEELRPRISVIGVGGAGGNAIANMIHSDVQGVDFIVANTDAQALNHSLADRKIQLGLKITQGLGAGSRPEIGKAAAEEALAEIEAALEGAHMCFIAAGMGGGTGTGAAPIIAKAARDRGILTVGVVTKPFSFEGNRRGRAADAGIAELQQHVDTLIVIPEPESVPHRQPEHDLQGSVPDGGRGAAAGRARDHRPDGHARPDQPRFRRRPLGHERDGQGDDGHRRGGRRQSRDRGGRAGDRQSACSTASA